MSRTIFLLTLLSAIVCLTACQATPTPVQPQPSPQATTVLRSPTPEPSATPLSQPTAGTTVADQPTAEPTAVPQQATDTPAPTLAPTTPPSPSAGAWMADGVVTDGEYAHEKTIGSVTLRWSNDAEHLYMAMQAKTKGWVSVGFKPAQRMQGADYILGFVKDGVAQIQDAYGNAPTGSHPADDTLGGTNDILAFAGSEVDGVTTIEFQIPLNSGDKYDNALDPASTLPLLVAVGAGDSFTSPHSYRGAGSITLD